MKAGDKVRIRPTSEFYRERFQLPPNTTGVVIKYAHTNRGSVTKWYTVQWNGGANNYRDEDVFIITFENYAKGIFKTRAKSKVRRKG